MEARAYRLSEMLSEQRAATRDNVQRKQARTGGERDEDDDVMAEPTSDDSDVDDDNDVPYNPKNLPLGWDGKVSRLITSLTHSLCSPAVFVIISHNILVVVQSIVTVTAHVAFFV